MTHAGGPGNSPPRPEPIGRVLALGGLALLGVTWQLWTPQNVFPRVPAFEWITTWPAVANATANWLALAIAVAALACLLICGHARLGKVAATSLTVAFLVLIVLDQHRLQPWVVHIAIGLLLVEFAPLERRTEYLRWFTASIYVYSALGKLDAQFLHTVGQELIGTLLNQWGADIRAFSDPARFWMAAALPIAELTVGIGLIFRWARVAAAIAAILMHLLLMAVLGPWGLQHAWGVLVWNLLFIALCVLLFLWPLGRPATNLVEPMARPPARLGWVEVLLLVVLIAPLGERLGWVDHWLGWALYAPHSSRAYIEVSAAAVPKLPAVAQRFVDDVDEREVVWRAVRVDRWSLGTLGAPVYPQQRFQLAVARALAERVGPREIRVHLLSTANRWTGRRTERSLEGRAELDSAAAQYWLNTQPIFIATP